MYTLLIRGDNKRNYKEEKITMLHNKRLSALLVGVAFFATSCMDFSSSGDAEGGEYFGDNTATREMEITESLYSTDGIDGRA